MEWTRKSSLDICRSDEDMAKDRSDWLIDAIATATQDSRFLRGEKECDEQLCEAIRLNAHKALMAVLKHKERMQFGGSDE